MPVIVCSFLCSFGTVLLLQFALLSTLAQSTHCLTLFHSYTPKFPIHKRREEEMEENAPNIQLSCEPLLNILFSNCCFSPLRVSFGGWIGQQCSGSSYATNYFKITSWWNILATACIWPLFFLQPKKSWWQPEPLFFVFKTSLSTGSQKIAFQYSFEKLAKSSSLQKFSIASLFTKENRNFLYFWAICSSQRLRLVLSNEPDDYYFFFFFHFYWCFQAFVALDPSDYSFFDNIHPGPTPVHKCIISQSLLFLLSIIL